MGFGVQGARLRAWGSGLRTLKLGFRVENLMGELLERPKGHGNVYVVEDGDVQPAFSVGSEGQSALDDVYVCVVSWSEFPVIPSYPHICSAMVGVPHHPLLPSCM